MKTSKNTIIYLLTLSTILYIPSLAISAHKLALTNAKVDIKLESNKNKIINVVQASNAYIDKQHLYISLKDVTQHLMHLDVNCTKHEKKCVIKTIPLKYIINLLYKNKIISITELSKDKKIISTKHIKLTNGSYIYKNHILSLDYHLFDNILSLKSKWVKSKHLIIYKTNWNINNILRNKRLLKNKSIIEKQAKKMRRKQRLKSIKAIKPKHLLNGGLKYQLARNENFHKPEVSSTSFGYGVMADILGGTLQTNGSYIFNNDKQKEPAWDYTFYNKKHFHLLKFGLIKSDSSLFMNSVNLQNGVQFDLNKSSDTSLNFTYTDQAFPGTDIELWRNDFLVSTITVGQSASFTVTDIDSEPGDKYHIKYFYPNGTEQTKTIIYSPDYNLLLGKNKWDINTTYGQIPDSDDHLGTLDQYLLRYGLTNKITLGVGHYDFNLIADQKSQQFNYADFDWQIFPSLNFHYQHMLQGHDFATRAISTFIKNNLLSVEYRRVDEDSDILKIPTVTGDYKASRRLFVEDRYAFSNGLRWVTTYEDSNVENVIESGLEKRINSNYSIKAQLGKIIFPDKESKNNFNSEQYFYINRNNFFNLKVNWNTIDKDTEILSYTYRKMANNRRTYALGFNLQHTGDDGIIKPTATFSWTPTPHWQASITGGKDTCLIQLSYTGVFGTFNKMSLPDHYGKASLSGKISLPTTSKQSLKNIQVKVGNHVALTNELGEFSFEGLPTHKRLSLTIEPEANNANFIAPVREEVLYLRPHTHIDYQSTLTKAAGIEGFLHPSHFPLPDDTIVEAIQSNPKQGIYETSVKSLDGFFKLTNLPVGSYKLAVLDAGEDFQTAHATLEPNQEWLSDINIDLLKPSSK